MRLPSNLEEATVEEIVKPIRKFMMARVGEYYLALLYFDYIVEAYDEDKGMYPLPPSGASDYSHVPEGM